MKYLVIIFVAVMTVMPAKAMATDQDILRAIIFMLESSKATKRSPDKELPSYYENEKGTPYDMQGYDDGNILIIHVPVPNSGGLTVPKFIFVNDKK
jgi:hypothetical protein